MERNMGKIKTGLTVASLVTIGLAGGLSLAPAASSTATVPQVAAAPVTPVAGTTARWEEDNLPPELYLWTDLHRGNLVGPGRANWLAARAYVGDGWHSGCWASIADTTLVMCPDGLIAYS